MALPPFFNRCRAASAAVLARGLAVTTTADPRAVEMHLAAGVAGFRIVAADRGCRCGEAAPKAQRQQQRFELGEHGVGSAGFSLVAGEADCWNFAGLLIKKKSRPLSPLLLDALKAPQPSPQEWISHWLVRGTGAPFPPAAPRRGGGPFEVRLERFSGNSQEVE